MFNDAALVTGCDLELCASEDSVPVKREDIALRRQEVGEPIVEKSAPLSGRRALDPRRKLVHGDRGKEQRR
jgi:hypothetical protein